MKKMQRMGTLELVLWLLVFAAVMGVVVIDMLQRVQERGISGG